MEYGWTRAIDSTLRDDFAGALRYGLTPRLELRFDSTQFATISQSTRRQSGFGDQSFMLKYLLYNAKQALPSVAVAYQIKTPTAGASNGIGTGYIDHTFVFLASKDAGRFHFDFNQYEIWTGGRGGFDHSRSFALAGAHDLTNKIGLAIEGNGIGKVRNTPSYATLLTGVTYTLSKRTVFDFAIDHGLTSAAPKRRIVLGFTHAFGRPFTRGQVR